MYISNKAFINAHLKDDKTIYTEYIFTKWEIKSVICAYICMYVYEIQTDAGSDLDILAQ